MGIPQGIVFLPILFLILMTCHLQLIPHLLTSVKLAAYSHSAADSPKKVSPKTPPKKLKMIENVDGTKMIRSV